MALLNSDQNNESKRIGGQFQIMKDLGILTDAGVAAADTVAGVDTIFTNALASANVHVDQKPQILKARRALRRFVVLEYDNSTTAANAAILPLTTVAGLIALTKAPAGFRQGFFQ